MAAPKTPIHTASASPEGREEHHRNDRHVHHRGKKANDPFLTRSLTAEVGKQFSGQPSWNQADDSAERDNSGSLLADLIITPLTMISFIFSLVLVDRQQRQWRLSQHKPDSTTAGWSRAWLDPEPYQASAAPGRETERAASEKRSANAYSGWYTRKKKRAMARMEISDALEMRKRVVFALLGWSILALWATASVLTRLYRWIIGT